MGQAELSDATGEIIIYSDFFFYGDASNEDIAHKIAIDIQDHWNEPEAVVIIRKKRYAVRFVINGQHIYNPDPALVWYNDNPRNNYFRIEEYINGNVSFVDAIGSNTGYFKLDNLLQTSTTAAHEYGHCMGLIHPQNLDIRGGGWPAIMHPRGTICDPHLQYVPEAQPGTPGGTLDPKYRKVSLSEIQQLNLHKLDFDSTGRAMIGAFSSIFHEKHLPA